MAGGVGITEFKFGQVGEVATCYLREGTLGQLSLPLYSARSGGGETPGSEEQKRMQE